ncbi:ABC transporter permease [Streptomyces sp. DSM 44917]|uniref:ABC transporter permease n=1 Tax=Streptomyces boetiae TaxID=3075541 RepID=A0ABU2L2E4_9ACTN|nr:ABC transporter permease [Streptomyces sp. DSM 44917]MDT0305731.1 ABC transporter permease [Streptomyces sp. DSM 44917]
MASSDTRGLANSPGGPAAEGGSTDLAGLEAGLDALDSAPASERLPLGRILVGKVLPPLVAIALVLTVWQLVYLADVQRDDLLPGPLDVWEEYAEMWRQGTLFEYVWTSVSRGILGFAIAILAGTPLGLLVARVKLVRAAIGPVLTGLQSLPSIAWVPAAIIWFGLSNGAIYTVVLLGAVPSIANGIVAGVDQIPPLYLRAGRMLGARGLASVRHVLLPAALPGYLAGLKQGWAFSWRSLMAAELIVQSPQLGTGLGQLMEGYRNLSNMAGILGSIILILVVGVAIDLLFFSPLERRVLRSRGLLARAS